MSRGIREIHLIKINNMETNSKIIGIVKKPPLRRNPREDLDIEVENQESAKLARKIRFI